MERKVDIENWVRKAHFQFFSKFEEPYYGVCVNMNCSAAYQFAKRNSLSFLLYCLYRSLSAAQTIEPFKHRIEQGEVFLHERIDAGSTIARSNGTFGYGHIIYRESLEEFLEGANREVERVRSSSDLTRTTADNIIRYSALPWIDFLWQNDRKRWKNVNAGVHTCASRIGRWFARWAVYRLLSRTDECGVGDPDYKA
jgi:chloramphenicol O-acetyltransferase type A